MRETKTVGMRYHQDDLSCRSCTIVKLRRLQTVQCGARGSHPRVQRGTGAGGQATGNRSSQFWESAFGIKHLTQSYASGDPQQEPKVIASKADMQPKRSNITHWRRRSSMIPNQEHRNQYSYPKDWSSDYGKLILDVDQLLQYNQPKAPD